MLKGLKKQLFNCTFLGLILQASLANALHYKVDSARDLDYGVILYHFYQHNYFDSLVEYQYTLDHGGIDNHGDYPEILDGGISLSYGLTNKAERIFTQLLNENLPPLDRNRAWFYLAKLFYHKNQITNAGDSLSSISGELPEDINDEYRYLATIINIKNGHYDTVPAIIAGISKELPYEPYLNFNLAVAQAKEGDTNSAINNLKKVTNFGRDTKELSSITDRAHFTLSVLAGKDKQYEVAWKHLQAIKTTGYYSNKALLSYSWMGINLEQFDLALPALDLLMQRSIALPEVQEAILLRPHVYEKQGKMGLALKGFIKAEKQYQSGLKVVDSARHAINQLEIPEDLVKNLEYMLSDDDWYGREIDVEYKNLSPFLLNLMTSHSFQSIVKELRDLYNIRSRLIYWQDREDEFQLMLSARKRVSQKGGFDQIVKKQAANQEALSEQYEVLKLKTLTLPVKDQERALVLLSSVEEELNKAQSSLEHLDKVSKPMAPLSNYQDRIKDLKRRVAQQEKTTSQLIIKLEGLLRQVVNAELDYHQERMNYYLIQSRLAKARLYDFTVNALEQTADEQGEQQ